MVYLVVTDIVECDMVVPEHSLEYGQGEDSPWRSVVHCFVRRSV